MILITKISDLSIYTSYVDLPIYDIFPQFDKTQFKILFSDVLRFYDVGEFWTLDLPTTKAVFNKSYQVRADYTIQLRTGTFTYFRATRFCDLADRKLAGGSWNARETAEVVAFAGSATDMNILTPVYNNCQTGLSWANNVYIESQRLQGLVKAAATVQACFEIIENYPVYPL